MNLAILVFLTLLHYAEQIGVSGTVHPSLHWGLTRHAVDRTMFLVPIIYSAYVFGFWLGITISLVSLFIMLPRAIFLSPAPSDALLETLAVILVGVIACQWLRIREREKERYQNALEELQSAHEQLQRYIRIARSDEKRVTTLNAISTVLTQSLQLKETLNTAINMVMDVMEAEVALLFTLDEETQSLSLLAYEGVSEEFTKEVGKVKVGEGFYGRVAKTGEPVAVRDESVDSASPAVKQMKIQAQIIVPISYKDRIVGIFCVGNRRPRDFVEAEVDLLTSVGNQMGIAIENSRLYERERLTAQQALASERRYREIFENANDAIWIHDLEGKIISANGAAAKLTGYSLEELIGMPVRSFLVQESLELAGQIRRKLFQRETVEQPYEQRMIKRDGTEAILMLTTNLIMEEGKPKGFQHIARDVTIEKRMQDNLRFYLSQIVKAQEEERRRIARELHDDTAQTLYGLCRQIDNFMGERGGLTAKEARFLTELRQQIEIALQGVRSYSQDLRPPMLDDLGLLSSLRWLAGEMEKEYQIKVDLKVSGAERRFGPDEELVIFRAIQEALRNVGRHAQATRAEVAIEFSEGKTKVSIVDNGNGFQLPAQLADLTRAGKLGLAGIEERVRLLGGNLSLQSQLGKGTTVVVEVRL